VTPENERYFSRIALCDIGPPQNRIASQQAQSILSFINREFPKSLATTSRMVNSRIPTLNWGNAFNVRTTNAIGMHRCDVGCDGASFGWLQ
jgi:hypothetical protein